MHAVAFKHLQTIGLDSHHFFLGLDPGVLKIEGMADTPITSILDEPTDYHEMEPSAGQVIQADSLKIWPVSQSVKPPLGSVLVTDGIYWTIIAVRYKNQVRTWECRCRNLSIINEASGPNAGLNVVTILKAAYTKGYANEAKPDWRGYVSGETTPTDADKVTCRLQPSSTDAMIRFTAEWSKETMRAIFQDQLPIDLAAKNGLTHIYNFLAMVSKNNFEQE